jgi:hypothetical protein
MPIVSVGPGGPPAVPAPPDPDPAGAFRDAPLAGRRTAVWATVTGAALLALVVPFAFPTHNTARTFPSLADGAADALPAPGDWQLTFAGLDASCDAPEPQPGTGGLTADCGRYDLDIVAMEGVSDPVHSARRAIRALWGTGTDHLDDVRFRQLPPDSSGVAQATGADAVWVSEPVGFTEDADTGFGDSPGGGLDGGPGGPGGPGRPGSPGSGSGNGPGSGYRPVQYGTTAASDETWVTTAALVRDGDLYTVMASAGSARESATALDRSLTGLGSDEDGDRA